MTLDHYYGMHNKRISNSMIIVIIESISAALFFIQYGASLKAM